MLSLDVGDVDQDNRRAVLRLKAGDLELLHFRLARRDCCRA